MEGRLSIFRRAFLDLEGNIILHHELLYNSTGLDMITNEYAEMVVIAVRILILSQIHIKIYIYLNTELFMFIDTTYI